METDLDLLLCTDLLPGDPGLEGGAGKVMLCRLGRGDVAAAGAVCGALPTAAAAPVTTATAAAVAVGGNADPGADFIGCEDDDRGGGRVAGRGDGFADCSRLAKGLTLMFGDDAVPRLADDLSVAEEEEGEDKEADGRDDSEADPDDVDGIAEFRKRC